MILIGRIGRANLARQGTCLAWAMLSLFFGFLSGCREPAFPPGLTLAERLQDADEIVRVRAIVEAAEQNRVDVVPLLVDRLEEDSQAVRFYAIQALVRLVGTDHGYDYTATFAQRREAIQRWRSAIMAESGDAAAEMENHEQP